MNYDEDLLVELIAEGELSHTEIAERVDVSRRTVWSIANGRSRPDLQQQIADTTEGYRQAAIRTAAKYMQPLLMKQIKIALEGEGETSRKAREFLLKNFMQILASEPAQAAEKCKSRLEEKRTIEIEQQYDKLVADEREVAESLKRERDMKFGPDDEYEDDFEDDYEDEYEDEENEESPTQPPVAVGATGRSPEPGAPNPTAEQSPPQNPETDHPTKAELTQFFDHLDATTPEPYQGNDPIVAYRKRLREISLEAIASAQEE
jgi:hypothetical protein